MSFGDIANVISVISGLMTILGFGGIVSWSLFTVERGTLAENTVSVFATAVKTGLCGLLLWPVFMLLAVTHIFVVLSVGPGAMGGDTFFWDSAHPASVGDWCLEFRRVLAGRRTCYDDRRPRPQSCCASPAR